MDIEYSENTLTTMKDNLIIGIARFSTAFADKVSSFKRLYYVLLHHIAPPIRFYPYFS